MYLGFAHNQSLQQLSKCQFDGTDRTLSFPRKCNLFYTSDRELIDLAFRVATCSFVTQNIKNDNMYF